MWNTVAMKKKTQPFMLPVPIIFLRIFVLIPDSYGIKLDQANDVNILDSEILGRRQGNGIDLWKSNRNQFKNFTISNVSDGIYLEQSNGNTLHSNKIENSRYGMHLMFSNDNVLK